MPEYNIYITPGRRESSIHKNRVMYQILCQRRRRGYHLEWVKVKKKEVPRDTTFGNTEFATSI
jgi:hypothetical protein